MAARSHILVTGGAGYIGSHICKALYNAGYIPVTFDNLSTGHREAVKWGPLVEGDILSAAQIQAAITEYDIQAIVHLAAKISVTESEQNPVLYQENNVAGTKALLHAAKSAGVNHLTFASTAAVYGDIQNKKIKENHPLAPINVYGQTKLDSERLIEDAYVYQGLNYIIFRFFNAVGADPEGDTGSRQTHSPSLVPVVLNVLHGHQKQLYIFGTDHPTPDGSAVRDYVHVSDIASAHVAAINKLLEGERSSHTLNIGTGLGHSVFEVIRAAERVCKRTVPWQLGMRRQGEVSYAVADSHEAQTVLSWQPKHTSLDEMLATAWLWSQQQIADKHSF